MTNVRRLICCGLAICSAGSLLAEQNRTWTNSTGKKEISGALVSVDSATQLVTIRRSDGKLFRTAILRFSEDDRRFVRDSLERRDKKAARRPTTMLAAITNGQPQISALAQNADVAAAESAIRQRHMANVSKVVQQQRTVVQPQFTQETQIVEEQRTVREMRSVPELRIRHEVRVVRDRCGRCRTVIVEGPIDDNA